MASELTFLSAAGAGLASFLSPCVLPLVPPYLTYIAGATIEEIAIHKSGRARRDVILAAVLFVAGFSTVFVGLGAAASALGQVLRRYEEILAVVSGLAVIAMGLHFLGVFRIGFLYREKRLNVTKPLGLWGGYVLGMAFAFGWTPCTGPILAPILGLASSEDTFAHGAALLGAYSAGLGVPFVLAAVALERFLAFAKIFRAYFSALEKIVGVLLIIAGVAFLTGGVRQLSFWLLEWFPGLATLG